VASIQIGPVVLDGAIEECLKLLVGLLTLARHLAFGDPAHAECLNEFVTERVETPWMWAS
jgi:hypothetical protein